MISAPELVGSIEAKGFCRAMSRRSRDSVGWVWMSLDVKTVRGPSCVTLGERVARTTTSDTDAVSGASDTSSWNGAPSGRVGTATLLSSCEASCVVTR